MTCTTGDNYFQYALWSFLLFVVNFVLIIVLALSVFKLKQLKPDKNEKHTWKRRMSTFGGTSLNMSAPLMGSMDSVPEDDRDEVEQFEEQGGAAAVVGVGHELHRDSSARGHIELRGGEARVSVGGTHTVDNPLEGVGGP